MTITQTKRGFNLNDCGLKIRFNSYEYNASHVHLFNGGVLVAIYENKEKFKDALKRC